MPAVEERSYPQKVIDLCRVLKKGVTPISKLPDDLRADEVIGYAFADGLVQIGRQMYSLVPVAGEMGAAGKLKRDEASGQPVLDEQKRQIVEKQYKILVDNEWSWMTRDSINRAPLQDVINEELPKGTPALHAKLTTAGLAATI